MVPRYGDQISIGGQDAYTTYNADLISFEELSSSISESHDLQVGKSSLILNYHERSVGMINLTFCVEGSSRSVAYEKANYLVEACKETVISFPNDQDNRFQYASVLSSYSIKEAGINNFLLVELNLYAVKRYALVTRSFTTSPASVTNEGTVKSGMILKVRSNTTRTSATINGITINNLQANTYFTIDGITGSVTKGNSSQSLVNSILDTNLIEFPKLNPGSNSIAFTNLNNVEISYYPTFLI